MKEIALGLVNGRWFCSDQMSAHHGNLLHSIFLPVMFMDGKILKEWKRDKVIHLAAPMSAVVGGRSINGYPIFSELTPLTEEDYKLVHELEQKLVKSMKAALGEKDDSANQELPGTLDSGTSKAARKAKPEAG